ncbi:ComF family protein [Microlunatus parietis]|nr:phosphoribosyltransferase family protein [Microlunatus parietis]
MGWLAAAGDLLLGARCPACLRPWWGLCPPCRSLLRSRIPRAARPTPCPAGFPPTSTAGWYDEPLRRLIVGHKERQALGLAPVLGELLAVACWHLIRTRPTRPDGELTLVPIPSARAAVRSRGYDATTALARRAAALLRPAAPVRVRRLLRHHRSVHDQSGLDAAARQRNLADSLRVRDAGSTQRGMIIIVDDLVTTGATLTEASRALAAAGMPVLGAATIAATRRHHSAAARTTP